MLNAILVSIPALVVLGVIGLSQLGPKLPTLSPNELKSTADYYNRMNRNGSKTHPRFASVVSFEVKEKRILYLKGRTT